MLLKANSRSSESIQIRCADVRLLVTAEMVGAQRIYGD